jgi:hypothetical protein
MVQQWQHEGYGNRGAAHKGAMASSREASLSRKGLEQCLPGHPRFDGEHPFQNSADPSDVAVSGSGLGFQT